MSIFLADINLKFVDEQTLFTILTEMEPELMFLMKAWICLDL